MVDINRHRSTYSVDVSVIKFLDLVSWGVQTHCGQYHLRGGTAD